MTEPRIIWTPWPPTDADDGGDPAGPGGGGLAYVDEDGDRVTPMPVLEAAGRIFPRRAARDLAEPYLFLTLHASFPITRRARRILGRVPGVEVVAVKTRYRALVGIGRCFLVSRTKRLVELALGCYRPPVSEGGVAGPGLRGAVARACLRSEYWLLHVEGRAVRAFPFRDPGPYRAALGRLRAEREGRGGLLLGSHPLPV